LGSPRYTADQRFFHKKYQKNLKQKNIGFIFKGILKSLGLGVVARPKAVEHEVAARPNALGSSTAGKPKLGFRRLLLVYWAKWGCKTQENWVCAPATPKQLGSSVPFQL